MGLVPIAFAKTERRTVYNMMTALGIKKIVLNLKASGDDVYFNSNGLLSHFASKLSSVVSNDAKKDALRFVSYSVTEDLTETLTVLTTPFTVISSGVTGDRWKYHPLICEGAEHTDSLLGLHETITRWYQDHEVVTANVTAELAYLVNETKHYLAEEDGDVRCPSVELTEMNFVPLLPFEGDNNWPGELPDYLEERFVQRYKDFVKMVEDAPKSIQQARTLLSYADWVPSRNSPWYLFSSEFHENLKQGQSFEVLLTIALCIISLFAIACIACAKYYCCPKTSIATIARSAWSGIASLRSSAAANDTGQESPAQQRTANRESSFPLQVYSRNYNAMHPRGDGSQRAGRFQVVYTPPAETQNQRSAHRFLEEL